MVEHIGRKIREELDEVKKENGNGNGDKKAEMLCDHIPKHKAEMIAENLRARGKEVSYIYNHFRGTLVHVCSKEEEDHWYELGYLISYYILDMAKYQGMKVYYGR